MMQYLKNIKVPTGNICIMQGEKGNLEFVSVGDYGKDANIKADFLGITREINGVPDGDIMPLSKKWVITISTQYGCSMGCKFCDAPKVGKGINVTDSDIFNQIKAALSLHPEITETERLNIHFARMGEPTFNPNVLYAASYIELAICGLIQTDVVHPVVSTMMPKNNELLHYFLHQWIEIKNYLYQGDAGLQLSINSTNEDQRRYMFSGNALTLEEISKLASHFESPIGRKYALNFALADNYEIDASKLVSLFSPDKFMVKITPLHRTASCEKNGIVTTGGYESFVPYKEKEEALKKAGFDVIVFVPSDEEEKGMITCGNAILSGKFPTNEIPQ